MGTKFSSENENTYGYVDRPSTSSGSRNRETATSSRHGRQHVFNPYNQNSGQNVLDQRFVRASSVVEGIRIPRGSGLRLYYEEANDDSNPSSSSGSARRARYTVSQSLPPYFIRSMLMQDSCCPMCKKMIPADDIEVHTVMCLTKPRVTYNEETLSATTGNECAICLDPLLEGDLVARLPCLCIYHKPCIVEWFERSQTCPEHPPD